MFVKNVLFPLFLLLQLSLFSSVLNAQTFDPMDDSITSTEYESIRSKNWAISFVPQHLISSGIRLDLERRLNKNHWLLLAPQYYSGTINLLYTANINNSFNPDIPKDKLQGLGLLTAYKRYFSNQESYLQIGLGLKYYEISYTDMKWLDIEIDKVPYYGYFPVNFNGKIYATQLQALAGRQETLIDNRFVLDYYGGLGLARTFSTDLEGRNYSRTFWDFNYSGVLLVLGLKIGTKF